MREYLRKRDKGMCGICFDPVNKAGTIDHIIPLSRGGTWHPVNLRLAHNRCNAERGAMYLPVDWKLVPGIKKQTKDVDELDAWREVFGLNGELRAWKWWGK